MRGAFPGPSEGSAAPTGDGDRVPPAAGSVLPAGRRPLPTRAAAPMVWPAPAVAHVGRQASERRLAEPRRGAACGLWQAGVGLAAGDFPKAPRRAETLKHLFGLIPNIKQAEIQYGEKQIKKLYATATLRKMALSAQQISRWLNSSKLSSFMTALQLRKHFQRPGTTLSCGIFAQPHVSSEGCFLQWGFRTYRTSSLWNSSQSAESSRQEINCAQSTLLPSVNEPSQRTPKIPGLDSEMSLEGLDDVPPLSPLQPISDEEAVQIIAGPPLPPSSVTLRDYVDHSETLRKLVLLGVDLSKIEKHPDAANLLLRLDFERDIKQMLLFLKDLGIEDTQLGPFLTKNYAFFSEDLENLKTRVAYLQSKNFSKADIAQMVRNAPFLLSFSVERLDNRLGFFQKELELSVKKTRDLVIRLPRLLTGSLEPVKENMKVFRLELGFQQNEIQHMITKIPKMLTANKRKLTEIFDYVHNVMCVPHHIIVRFPQVFNTRLFKVKERHLFLAYLGRAQYDPTKPNYISLDKLVSVPDGIFCEGMAKASVRDFEKFLKTL